MGKSISTFRDNHRRGFHASAVCHSVYCLPLRLPAPRLSQPDNHPGRLRRGIFGGLFLRRVHTACAVVELHFTVFQ